jgi:hypothetical protein
VRLISVHLPPDGSDIPEKQRVFGDVLDEWREKTSFPAHQRANVYFRMFTFECLLSIDGCALFGETVGSNTA